MNKEQLRSMVAELLREMGETPETPKAAVQKPEGAVPDITAIDLRNQYLVEQPADRDAFLRLKRRTPARLAGGRAGARYRTVTMLRFRADHAAARDTVFSLVEPSFWEKNGLVFVQTKCRDKDQYLTRPDLGRRFDEEAQTLIRQTCGQSPRVVLVIGDGLSSDAVTANAMDCARAIAKGLENGGIRLGKTLFVQFARVGASDHIGQITDAELVCMLVGERPGLVTSESMSAYITYKPRPGIPESKRTVVSNIHRQGTPAVEAGAHIAKQILTMLEKKASGIDLR